MQLTSYEVVGLAALLTLGLTVLGIAIKRPARRAQILVPDAWKQYRFGFAVYALIFLAFDMEMIFMYPWGTVFANLRWMAFFDMLVFIALLGAGIAYAWAMGGLEWE